MVLHIPLYKVKCQSHLPGGLSDQKTQRQGYRWTIQIVSHERDGEYQTYKKDTHHSKFF